MTNKHKIAHISYIAFNVFINKKLLKNYVHFFLTPYSLIAQKEIKNKIRNPQIFMKIESTSVQNNVSVNPAVL